ncbi:isochorismate synthase [Marinirhabdus gelatinilytica]|uniref:isochorismate synthase n=1 Tax=Marinirhabdus gelatinilytica TaxID=1703343 RepID=A0A370QFA0_9FLAO|nr:isochorismate synthase [Marinirhabdus gelatinilytica]RDK87045.1 isochorismate synthase [Marinirhabdus gelatinilytica]
MQYPQLTQKALGCFENNVPFVLFSIPGSNSITGIFQKDVHTSLPNESLEDSFIFSPFNLQQENYRIPLENSDSYNCMLNLKEEEISPQTITIDETKEDKQAHLTLVNNAIDKIQTGNIQKVVVSRKKEISLQGFQLQKLCDSLFSQNPSAFRYVWYHPKTALWCGATPEVLIKTKDNAFTTMALAGTQKIENTSIIFWGDKEKNEQQWVVDAIVDSLLDKTTALNISKTKSHIAGNLAHLRTDIKGVLNTSRYGLKKVVEALHPTPAVCGTPTKRAQDFIYKNENYDREFYTGFLGISNAEQNSTDLFVNLRCIKIDQNNATLFAGGGITKDSNAEDEWLETHNKMQTMIQVLQPLL